GCSMAVVWTMSCAFRAVGFSCVYCVGTTAYVIHSVVTDDNQASGLPGSIEASWGLRERPTKGPKPGLTIPRLVDAGVGIAREEGLAAVSMARVAKALGASTMALYRYVAAKDELLDLMAD